MTQFAYTPETWAALTRNPEDRSKALRRLLENMGGRLVYFYNSFGSTTACSSTRLPTRAPPPRPFWLPYRLGTWRAFKATTLLSVEDSMEAMRKADEATYRRPGQ
jgi:hypothetical protein